MADYFPKTGPLLPDEEATDAELMRAAAEAEAETREDLPRVAPIDQSIKASRRHSAADEMALKKCRTYLKAAGRALDEAGAPPDEDGDGTPDTEEMKAADLHSHIEMVEDAILTALYTEDGAPEPDDDEPRLLVYPDYAILMVAGRNYRVPYTMEAGEVQPAPATEWVRVEAEWTDLDGAPAYADAPDGPPTSPEPDGAMKADEVLTFAGAEVKALPGGKIGGYLIRFGDAVQTDISSYRDYFDRDTDFGNSVDSIKTPIYFNHRLPLPAGKGRTVHIRERIGDGELKMLDDGIFIEAVLYSADQYQKVLDKLGWSSGTAAHLVDREKQANGAHKITHWPLGLDASLTPIPAEPRTRGVMSVKVLATAQADTVQALAEALISAVKSEPDATPDDDTSELLELEEDMDKDTIKSLFTEAITEALAPLAQRVAAIEQEPATKSAGWTGGAPAVHVKSRDEGIGDFLLCVRNGETKRLAHTYKSVPSLINDDGSIKDLSEGVGSAGGYLVPPTFEAQLSALAGEMQIFNDAGVYFRLMTSAEHHIPMLTQTTTPTADGQSAYYGGISATWEPEGATGAETQPAFEQMKLQARKLMLLTESSNELVEDAPGLQADLVRLFTGALAHQLDWCYINGNGVGKPLGVFNSGALLSVGGASGGASRETASTITVKDLAEIMGRFYRAGDSAPIWIANHNAIAKLISLSLNNNPVFLQNGSVVGPLAGTLFGIPIAFSEKVPAVGTAGDIGLYDRRAYVVGRRRGMTVAISEHASFRSDSIVWRVTYRGDGQPRLRLPIPQDNGNSLSPFVRLN